MNLTTPAVTINPVSDAPDPAAVAADLRDIADAIENNPHLATMIAKALAADLWPLHVVDYLDPMREDPRAVMAATIRQLMPIATGPVDKQYDDKWFRASIPMRGMTLTLTDERARVCTRVVTGTETVMEEVPDPAYIAKAPLIKQTREVETVEWECGPLMGAASTK